MAIWIVRAGRSGEFESRFLDDKRVYLTWDNLKMDIASIKTWDELINVLDTQYQGEKKRTLGNWAGQIWSFAMNIKIGDWVVLPSKFRATIHFGEVTSDYTFNSKSDNPFYHFHSVNWFATDIPRLTFDQDLLFSFGAFLTVCKISRNNAEERIKKLYKNNWNSNKIIADIPHEIVQTDSESSGQLIQLEELANDQIAMYLSQKFKGHGMARIIQGIMKAKGFTVYKSPEGPDKGVDLLAAPEPYGFGVPRICIQVKTGDVQVDRPTLDQLLGVMSNFHAEQGILASWSGFKTTVYKEVANQFFKVRLWDQNEIIKELLINYDKLDEELRSEIPLKRIWTLTNVYEE